MITKISLTTKYDTVINSTAKDWNVDKNLVKAIIKVESNFNPNAHRKTSKENSKGLMQINEPTALSLGVNKSELNRLFEPDFNIKYGCKLLNEIKNAYPSILDQIAVYNAGRIIKRKNNTYVNQGYVKNVYSRWLLYTFTSPLNLSV